MDGHSHCSFTQTHITRKGKPDEFRNQLVSSIDQIMTGSQEMCRSLGTLPKLSRILRESQSLTSDDLNALGVTDPDLFFGSIARMPDEQKDDLIAISEASDKFCTHRTRDNAEAFVRASHDKDMRTCKVRSNTYD